MTAVVADTSVLSLAFRRSRPDLLGPADRAAVEAVRRLAKAQRVFLTGMVRQEVLSGVRSPKQFEALRTVLDGFQYLPLDRADHDAAAEAYNRCQAHGIAAGPVDILVCALSVRHGLPVFATDADFARYATVLPIKLFDPPT